ncbi:protein sym-1-like [Humulus lupulus]|uniref:protein sym-1-like n=1 Tax=Humulus lupulus TaxID=3486 RepID=UPI002B409B24|nr:protein sym-1-like [Humulus lupulus]
MSGALMRNAATIPRLFKKYSITDILLAAEPIGAPAATFVRTQQSLHQSSRAFVRFPQFLRKAKEFELSPSSFSSAFSSSSSSSSAAAKEVGIIGWYLGMVKCRPILTKSVTSSLIYIAADLSSQTIAQKLLDSYDFLRTLRMAGYGLLVLGPSLHFWFNFMSKLYPKRDLLSTLKKMAMGQGIYGPTMTVIFFSLNARLQGETGSEIVSRLKRDLFPTLLNGVMYWPMCDFITFRFIPVHLQPLVSNSFSYLWTVYMTYMAGLEKATVTTAD